MLVIVRGSLAEHPAQLQRLAIERFRFAVAAFVLPRPGRSCW